MSEMIEQVARALGDIADDKDSAVTFRALLERLSELNIALGSPALNADLWLREMAACAIAAMRKPTDAMLDDLGNGDAAKWAPGIWQAMIDTALAENAESRA